MQQLSPAVISSLTECVMWCSVSLNIFVSSFCSDVSKVRMRRKSSMNPSPVCLREAEGTKSVNLHEVVWRFNSVLTELTAESCCDPPERLNASFFSIKSSCLFVTLTHACSSLSCLCPSSSSSFILVSSSLCFLAHTASPFLRLPSACQAFLTNGCGHWRHWNPPLAWSRPIAAGVVRGRHW